MDEEHDDRSTQSPVRKPAELLTLGGVTRSLFEQIKRWFDVPDYSTLDLSAISSDTIVQRLNDAQASAAHTLYLLQELHYAAAPETPVRASVPLNLIGSILDDLQSAPERRLEVESRDLDWEREWSNFDNGLLWRRPPPQDELARFDAQIGALVDAHRTLIRYVTSGNPVLTQRRGPGQSLSVSD